MWFWKQSLNEGIRFPIDYGFPQLCSAKRACAPIQAPHFTVYEFLHHEFMMILHVMDAPLTVALLSAFLVCSWSLPTKRDSDGGHDGESSLCPLEQTLAKLWRALPFAQTTLWTNFAVAMTAEGRGFYYFGRRKLNRIATIERTSLTVSFSLFFFFFFSPLQLCP